MAISADYLETLFATHFGELERKGAVFASAPGRLEVAGNHTDHQGGLVISAAANLRIFGLGRSNGLPCIRVYMDGFGLCEINLVDHQWGEPVEAEETTSKALIRGMAAAWHKDHPITSGFDLVTSSEIPVGCGISSSAAFEMLLGAFIARLYGGPAYSWDPIELALTGADVERRYFGKPCGAQDQLASACGGMLYMDFSKERPEIFELETDFSNSGLSFCLVDSHQDHAEFGDEFALVAEDMFDVARYFGFNRLSDVSEDQFFSGFNTARTFLGDRRVLRALHYFGEVDRVARQKRNLEEENYADFIDTMRLAGASSAQYLQNVSPRGDGSGGNQQPMIILSLCSHLLKDQGAWRIHGGGFGGSVMVCAPSELLADFSESMDRLLGYPATFRATIDQKGAIATFLD